jgi:hypothetical protein
MTAMSLDFDRSPDGEPTAPADQTPVPAHAPSAMGPAQPIGPSFTPAPVPADAEPADADQYAVDQTAADKPAAGEPGPAETATNEATADDHTVAEPAADEPAADEPAADEHGADEPGAFEPATGDLAATEAAADEPTASELTAYRSSAAPAWDGGDTRTADGSAGRTLGTGPTADLDGPLISDADELRTSWQRIQAAFVDDPRDAVADAAGLVEHTAQALTAALRQRQRQLRARWDPDGMPDGVEYADSGGTAPGATSPDGGRQAADDPDTEQLRLLIQRYRALFNHLCRP